MDIYIIKNTINDKVYIGKTIHTTLHRWYEHLKHLDNGQYIHNAMKKLKVENFYVETLETNIQDIATLNEREKYWISYYNCQVPNGYNIQPGGDDGNWTKETWQQWAELNPEKAQQVKDNFEQIRSLGTPALMEDRKNNPEKYKIHDDQSAENLRKWKVTHQEENALMNKTNGEKLQQWMKDNPELNKKRQEKVADTIRKQRSKKVICITTGEIFDSMSEAERQTGISHGHISQVCNGKRHYAGKTSDGKERIWQYYIEE